MSAGKKQGKRKARAPEDIQCTTPAFLEQLFHQKEPDEKRITFLLRMMALYKTDPRFVRAGFETKFYNKLREHHARGINVNAWVMGRGRHDFSDNNILHVMIRIYLTFVNEERHLAQDLFRQIIVKTPDPISAIINIIAVEPTFFLGGKEPGLEWMVDAIRDATDSKFIIKNMLKEHPMLAE